jgi:acyl carrier protein
MTVDQALAWVAETFEEPRTNIQQDTRRADIAAWDSLGQLILMSALDQQFGIRLNQTELASLSSVQDILNILSRNRRMQTA